MRPVPRFPEHGVGAAPCASPRWHGPVGRRAGPGQPAEGPAPPRSPPARGREARRDRRQANPWRLQRTPRGHPPAHRLRHRVNRRLHPGGETRGRGRAAASENGRLGSCVRWGSCGGAQVRGGRRAAPRQGRPNAFPRELCRQSPVPGPRGLRRLIACRHLSRPTRPASLPDSLLAPGSSNVNGYLLPVPALPACPLPFSARRFH